MEFSEEQLQEVFSQFDAEGDGYIALDQVRTFAEQAGLTNTSVLDTLGDADGNITFDSFVTGVKALARTDSPAPPSPAKDKLADLPSGNGRRRAGRKLPGGPPSRLTRSASAVSLGDSRREGRESESDKELRQLRKQVKELTEHDAKQKEELTELRVNLDKTQKRCHEYESQLKYAEESQEMEGVLKALEVEHAKVTKEKEKQAEDKIELELRLTALEDEKATLAESLDERRKAAEAADEQVAALTAKLAKRESEAAEELGKLGAAMERAANEHKAELSSTVAHLNNTVDTAVDKLEREVASLKAALAEEQRRHDTTQHELERQLEDANKMVAHLEKVLDDPKEFEARFIKMGMSLASHERSGDSLAAEMNSASKDEVVDELKKLADENTALRRYCDQLLATVIDRIPEILEIPKRRSPSAADAGAASGEAQAQSDASASTSAASSPSKSPTKSKIKLPFKKKP